MQSRQVQRLCERCGEPFMMQTSPSKIATGRGRYCSRSCSTAATSKKHGHAGRDAETGTYYSWAMMKSRCTNPKAPNYQRYGGRGITVCERWSDFANFLADMGERPVGHTLERDDTNGPYCASNCKWATPKQQQRNRRTNVMVTFDGRTQCAADWAAELGLSRTTLGYRLHHWPLDRALTPIRSAAA